MPIYSISYTSHEDSSIIYLEHDNEYTQEEFDNIVIEAIVELCRILKSGARMEDEMIHGPCALSPANIGRILGSRNSEWPNIGAVSDLFPDIGYFMERYGFKIINSKCDACFWGWADPFEEASWDRDSSSIDKNLYLKLKEAGFTQEDSRRYQCELRMRERREQEEKIEGQNRTCHQCGKEFFEDNPTLFDAPFTFCSKECADQWSQGQK